MLLLIIHKKQSFRKLNMNPNVLLISMPWAPLNEPSIGLGILKTILIEKKINVKVVNLNIYLLEYLTADTYVSLYICIK